MADVRDERLEWLFKEIADLRQSQQDGFEALREEIHCLRKDINGRLRSLENWRAWVLGAAAAASAIATWVWQLTR